MARAVPASCTACPFCAGPRAADGSRRNALNPESISGAREHRALARLVESGATIFRQLSHDFGDYPRFCIGQHRHGSGLERKHELTPSTTGNVSQSGCMDDG